MYTDGNKRGADQKILGREQRERERERESRTVTSQNYHPKRNTPPPPPPNPPFLHFTQNQSFLSSSNIRPHKKISLISPLSKTAAITTAPRPTPSSSPSHGETISAAAH
ncbi:hypothetical protein POPTR_010G134450v4 [Populus trichocarpa]|uniref:Uncharacterized protein n=1 Tax=Populus trichocarpa TaxID=3694 RepID=A0ACC0SDA1_POPTR|nr:hypothetical protein POPTR_010G134450v4 [Populus trichocarpa]